VHEDDFVRVQVPVRWDNVAGRNILVAHHELPRSPVQPIHLDDEREVSTSAIPSLALILLEHESGRGNCASRHRWRAVVLHWNCGRRLTASNEKKGKQASCATHVGTRCKSQKNMTHDEQFEQ
jgi:hypothetical protein